MTNVGKDVELRGHLGALDGHATRWGRDGKPSGGVSKNRDRSADGPAAPLPRVFPKGLTMSPQPCPPRGCSRQPGRGSSPGATSRWTEKEDVAVCLAHHAAARKEEVLPSATTWVGPEDTRLR